MSIIGKWIEEVTLWKGRSITFVSRIKKAQFPRKCGSKIFPFLWVPKFRYAAGIICFSRNQYEEIQAPVARECITASGFRRQFPRLVIFGT